MKVLIVNSLDSRYGSTYRFRKLYKLLKGHFETFYVESNFNARKNEKSISQADNIFGYLIGNIRRFYLCMTLEYDTLFVQKFLPLTAPCILAAKLRKKTIVVDWDDVDKDLQENLFRRKIVAFTEWFWPRYAKYITTHSEYIKNYAKSRTKAEIYTVNQGVDFDHFDPAKHTADEIESKYCLIDKFVIGHMCTLTEGGARDIDKIFEVTNKLYSKYNDIVLLVVGGGPKEKEVLNKADSYGISEIVRVTGMVDQEDIPKYLSTCDVSLVYMRDNLGNRGRVSFKVLESLALNKNVIGHLVGETEERFGNLVTESGEDTDSMVNAIESVYNGEVPIISAREGLKREYDWKNIGVNLIKIFRDIESKK